MSIIVQDLTKKYQQQLALDNVNFSCEKGKITGFLGPNGAGKSTTMKIATGYIQATKGTIMVAGVDVGVSPLEVKKNTGYLPEHNPLYLEMYVKEYLSFIASAYKLKSKNKRVEEVIALVGLESEMKKKIQSLSKGYRQRVGLAQALIHDPEVLILDEPTSGLDPNQLAEVRKVIREVSENKTVLFSTHIMQEVDALCDNVVIINKGSIVANDNVKNLKSKQSDKTEYRVEFETEIDIKVFEQADLSIEKEQGFTYKIFSQKGDPRKEIMSLISEKEMPLLNISKVEQTLEIVFQQLTKDA